MKPPFLRQISLQMIDICTWRLVAIHYSKLLLRESKLVRKPYQIFIDILFYLREFEIFLIRVFNKPGDKGIAKGFARMREGRVEFDLLHKKMGKRDQNFHA